ncbi:hypothetical protein LSM04_000846 [Trypanosoma melophagium]|uniref:uncharacterized protein n=1 Tax=Trypanosoma melophagium TaxID=715481 RepID=UPI00351AA698|nr:hypothetical protein LSM04_000846 [Trypanosoma melophagium]
MSSFLVPFTLQVKCSDWCESLHEEIGPILSLLTRKEGVSTVSSPVSRSSETSGDMVKCLLAPVVLAPLEGDLVRERTDAMDFVVASRSFSKHGQLYVRLVFQEYCQRKNIEKERESVLEDCEEALKQIKNSELSPEIRAMITALEMEESEERGKVHISYNRFVEWVDATTSLWLDEVHRLESERSKAAAVNAAKRALESEFARKSEGNSRGEYSMANEEVLRQQAIALIEQEQKRELRAKEEQVQYLRQQEEQLRQQIEENRRLRKEEKEKQRDIELESRYMSLMQEESSIRQRMSQREEECAQREMERGLLLEHIEAEEQLLRQRLQEQAEEELLRQRLQRYDEMRAAEAEAARKREEEEREQLYEHVRAEEEILRQRLEKRRKEEAEKKAKEEQGSRNGVGIS